VSLMTLLTILTLHLAELAFAACEGATHHVDVRDDATGDTDLSDAADVTDLPDLGPPDGDGVGLDAPLLDAAEPPTWELDVAPVFAARCVPCHGTWANSYAGVVPRIESGRLRAQVSSGHRISGPDQTLVLAWLDAGYPER
jgi:hypothetical protein